MMIVLRWLRELIDCYFLCGIKGLMGIGQDMFDLLGGDCVVLVDFEWCVVDFLGFVIVFNSVGQVYLCLLDYDVVLVLVQFGVGLLLLVYMI